MFLKAQPHRTRDLQDAELGFCFIQTLKNEYEIIDKR